MSEVLTAHRITINGSVVIKFITYACSVSGLYINCISYSMPDDTYEYDVTCTEEDISYIKLKYG
jgi:hypothetical protein